jgi:uncharacterized membrane protein required for colicin V production
MIGLRLGFWDIADQSLQWTGRSAAWLLLRKHFTRDESALCAATGGALVCALFGGAIGFALSSTSQNIDAMAGTIIGGLLGVCFGFIFGVSVEAVSGTIKDLLRSLDSK